MWFKKLALYIGFIYGFHSEAMHVCYDRSLPLAHRCRPIYLLLKLCHRRLRLGIRKRFFPQRVVGHWKSSPGKWSQQKPNSIQERLRQCTWTHGVILGPVLCRAERWISMIPVGVFQVGIFIVLGYTSG